METIEKPRICRIIDTLLCRIGHAIAMLTIALACVILIQVILRYMFGKGLVALEELQWHLYAILIMTGIGFGVAENTHIRLDIFHRSLSDKIKALIEALGIVFLLMPVTIILFLHGIDFVESALRVHERSDSPLGLPYRWIIKSVIPLSMVLIMFAGISRLLYSIVIFFNPSRSSKRRKGA